TPSKLAPSKELFWYLIMVLAEAEIVMASKFSKRSFRKVYSENVPGGRLKYFHQGYSWGPEENGNRSTRMTLVPRKEKLDLIFFSRESTKVKTAIIANIPIVTPNNESMVLVKFALSACRAKTKLSQINLNTIT